MLTYEERIAIRLLISEARKKKVTQGDRECARCGEPFTPSWKQHAAQLYCSVECRSIVHRGQAAERQRRIREQAKTAA